MARELDRAVAVLAERFYGHLRHDHAIELGFTQRQIDRRLAAGRWRRVHDEVYRLGGAVPSFEGAALAACWAGGLESTVSHRTAAALYGVAGGRRSPIEIVCPRWNRTHISGLVVREMGWIDSTLVTTIGPVHVVSPELLLLQLAAVAGDLTVLMAYDRLHHRELLTWSSVEEFIRVRSRRGVRGMRRLRALHAQRDPSAAPIESEQETALLDLIARSGLPVPRPQVSIHDDADRFVCRTDFAYTDTPVVIFYDSDAHHLTPIEIAKDHRQRRRLQGLGYGVVVARKDDIRSGGRAFLDALREELDVRSRRSA